MEVQRDRSNTTALSDMNPGQPFRYYHAGPLCMVAHDVDGRPSVVNLEAGLLIPEGKWDRGVFPVDGMFVESAREEG